MEWETKVKSSLNNEESFHTFETGLKTSNDPGSTTAYESNRFSSAGQFWKLIQGDPELSREFEQLINEKVNTRVETQKRELLSQMQDEGREIARLSKEKGHQEGFEFGRREGDAKGFEEKKESMEQQIDRISQAINYIVSEKDRLLRSHEQSWLEALEYILVHCLVPRAPEIIKAVHGWMSNELAEFGNSKCITLAVSPAQFSDYQTALAAYKENRFTLRIDDQLALGDLRVEMDNGGMQFSDHDSLERLREIIHQVGHLG